MSLLAEGRHALVTGATRGIGLAITRALRQRGVDVLLVARSQEQLDEAARDIGGTVLATDLTNENAVKRLTDHALEQFGGAPDIVINAAGAFGLAAVHETTVGAFDSMIATNLRAPFLLVRALLPSMVTRRSGHIVSIGSVAGRQAFPGNSAYSASKFGLRGFHEVLELELKGTGVRATLVEPAATDTAIWDAVDHDKNPGLPERSQMLQPEAVADCVIFALERPPGVTVKYMGIERS